MKANRKFLYDEEAVSPVIAVILMVAITVVLAATVFVLVSDIGSKSSKSAPQIGWSDDTVANKWVVNQAPNSINWNAFKIKTDTGSPANAACCKYKAPGMASAQSMGTTYQTLGLDAAGAGSVTTSTIAGGDQITFCLLSGTTAVPQVTVTMLHTDSNSIAHQYTFTSITQTAC